MGKTRSGTNLNAPFYGLRYYICTCSPTTLWETVLVAQLYGRKICFPPFLQQNYCEQLQYSFAHLILLCSNAGVSNDLLAGAALPLATVWIPTRGGRTRSRINLLVVNFLSHLRPLISHDAEYWWPPARLTPAYSSYANGIVHSWHAPSLLERNILFLVAALQNQSQNGMICI